MVKAAPPSGNPANSGDLAGAIQFALTKYGQRTDDMLPAKVLSYSRVTNMAKVLPMIPAVTTAKEVVQKAIVAEVPVLQLGGGGFVLTFPLAAGDLGWIKANDRDISLFKKNFSNASGPPSQRTHTFEDAMFIPDTMFRQVTVAETGGVCLQTLDGTTAVSIVGNEVRIKSPEKVKVTAPEVELTSATKITMTAPIIDFVSPNINCNGINFETHQHTGVDPGAGNSDGPVNP